MKKSILVIDTPETCEKCFLCRDYTRIPHFFSGNWLEDNDTYEVKCMGIGSVFMQEVPKECVPDWCPLQKVPSKKEDSLLYNDYVKGTVDGYNACIEEIIK